MTMDFSDADIRNILKLIGEVSKVNIVWGGEVKGRVSMRLRDIPWDQALEVVLEANELGMKRQQNIIWVTTKQNLIKIETLEKDKKREEADRIRAMRAAYEASKQFEQIVTSYIQIDFADAVEIAAHIKPSGRGTVTVDKRTNTILYSDTKAHIEDGKKIAKLFDTPVKQVMIEARIVEATTSFGRNIGVEWTGSYQTSRHPWGDLGRGRIPIILPQTLACPPPLQRE